MSKKSADQSPNTSRIEAFSDGVFSIVITLLVLELDTPELKNQGNWVDLFYALYALTPKFVGYVMSFFFVAVFWVSHHQFFQTLNYSKRWLLWINLLFLFFVSFIPFPTAVLGAYHENKTAIVFFGASFFAASLTFAVLRWYGWVDHGVTKKEFEESSIKKAILRSFIVPLLYLAGIILSFFNTFIGVGLFFLTPALLIAPLKLKTAPQDADDIIV